MDHDISIIQRKITSDNNSLDQTLNVVLQRVFLAREVRNDAQLDYRLTHLHGPDSLTGINEAAGLLADVMVDDGTIVVVGDYDADGATGTALALRALHTLGAGNVDFRVPNRFEHGYGLTPELFRTIHPPPDLIITVDNGIASLTGVEAARAAGCRVLVTDHHLPGELLPVADAIVNPNLEGDQFPSKNLAGVGVVFYLMAALRQELKSRGLLSDPKPLAGLLDLVVLGTVADLVPLDLNNRRLVSQGLARIRAGHACAGILALLEASNRDVSRTQASDLAFAIGPRLNAAGRLEDMSLGIELLLTDDPEKARQLAAELDRINGERRTLQESMIDEARAILARLDPKQLARERVICLFDPDWHQGVVGLVASRVKEQTGRPVLAFAPEEAGHPMLKGSGRSVRGLHMRDLLAALDARHPGLIGRFGGHAMAAGLSLGRARLDEFRAALADWAKSGVEDEWLGRKVMTDGQLSPSELNLETATALQQGGPWGQGFPEPVFDGEFEIIERRVVGLRHLKMRVVEPTSGLELDAIAFNTSADSVPGDRSIFRLVYQLVVNEFRGRRSAELLVRYIV